MTPGHARTLLARLLHGVAPEVDIDQIDPAAPLQEAAELDSMDFLNLVTALHEETGIDVPERDYPLVATIDGFVIYVAAADAAGTDREAHHAT
jgi:acyl carrier protein